MSNAPQTTSTNGSANGTKPRERKLASAGQTMSGRFHELACVLLFIASAVFLVLGFQSWRYWLVSLASFVGAILFYFLATREALARLQIETEEHAKLQYRVTEIRLLTLKSIGVPPDLRSALGMIRDEPAATEEQFLEKVAHHVSWERINLWKEQILTHTRTGDMLAPISSVNAPEQSPTVVTT